MTRVVRPCLPTLWPTSATNSTDSARTANSAHTPNTTRLARSANSTDSTDSADTTYSTNSTNAANSTDAAHSTNTTDAAYSAKIVVDVDVASAAPTHIAASTAPHRGTPHHADPERHERHARVVRRVVDRRVWVVRIRRAIHDGRAVRRHIDDFRVLRLDDNYLLGLDGLHFD